jgi:rSAM/selenodomain-associated transferase 1
VASGRRWDRHGALRTILAMAALRFAYWRGASPDDLVVRYYGRAPVPRPLLQVFAKAPLPGRVKTRLARDVGDDAAVAAYRTLAAHTLDVAARARRAGVVEAVELWVEPGAPREAFATWLERSGATLHEQQGGNLGARMQHALRTGLARGRAALLIGSDVPGFDVAYLAQAAAALAMHDAVVGPAEDGGYVLIGLARDVDAFADVAWSTPEVLGQTRARLAANRARWAELPTLWDVDTVDDWRRWRQEAGAA